MNPCRLCRSVLLLLALGIVGQAPVSTAADGSTLLDAASLAKSVKIYRDQWGVPHIDGPTDASVIFAFAYAQCEDYFWQVEDSCILALGRYAEAHGQKELQRDMLHRSFEIARRAQEDYPKQDAETKSMCEASIAGINYYLAKHPEVKPRLITKFEPWMALAVARTVTLEMNFGKVKVGNHVPQGYQDAVKEHTGSNAWALAPQHTASKEAMLFINPHQPYFGYGQFYEGHLRSGEGWNMTGATFFCGPLPGLGHNENLGWAFTVNEPDLGDAWREVFDDPKNPLNYRYEGGYRQAVEWREKIKVKKGKSVDEVEVTLRKTHHGPIVKKQDDTTYISANIAKLHEAFIPRQLRHMVRAKNLDEFKQAMGMLEFHIFNTVYADKDGNIAYFYNGVVPKRDPSYDWTKPVDGTTAKTEWQGLHPFSELPHAINPPSGFVQNCNQSPFTITDDGNPSVGDYPPYMVQEKHDDKRRAKVSRMVLRELDNATYDKWVEAIFDTTVYWAVVELPRYQREFERLKTSQPDLAAKVEPYVKHLCDWDCVNSIQCTQMPLLVLWYEEMYGQFTSETLKREFINDLPNQFQALATAADKLKETFGEWKVAWGDVSRLQRHANVSDFFQIPFNDKLPSVPSAGFHGPLGSVFTMYFTPSINLPPLKVMKKHYAVVGASYQSAVEFTDRIRAGSLIQFGSSGDPKSPHFDDQAKLLSQKKLKDAWFYWDDVERNAKRVYHPGEEAHSAAATQAGGK